MSDNREYWKDYVSGSGDLVFVKPADAGGAVVFLSRADGPVIDNDRDRALLRAYLTLALKRLDEQEIPQPLRFTSWKADHPEVFGGSDAH